MFADLNRLGALGATFYLFHRVLQRLSGGRARLLGYWFYVQPVSHEKRLPPAGGDTFLVRPIQAGDVADEAFGRPAGVVAQRFADGSVCIAASRADELAGFMWLHFGTLSERLVRCDFEPRPAGLAAWDYDLFIAPKYRLGRLFARIWDAADEVLRARGARWTVSWVEFSNRASSRAHERLGATRIGWAVFLCLGVLQVALTSISPFVHLSTSERSRCHLRIQVPGDTIGDSS